MQEAMEKMEQERAEMVAEIEAQIENALASMTVGMDDSDYGESSRPSSRLSSVSGALSRSRAASDSGKARHMRSFGTESTLAESLTGEAGEDRGINGIIEEDEEAEEREEELSPKKKRFSASEVDMPQDGMHAVDEGISVQSDRIAQKVLAIQQKVLRLYFATLSVD